MSGSLTIRSVREFCRNERGTTAIEYALIAAGVSITIVAVISTIGSQIMVVFYDKLTNIL
jgi:pilus assembly protein Flp/PilA